jgi:hypothetical protein
MATSIMTGVSVADCVSGLAGDTASMTTGAATAPRITIRTAAIRPRIDVSQHVYMRNRPRLLLALARDVLVDFSPSALDAGIELVLENDGRPTAPVYPRGRDTRPRYCRSGCRLLMCAQRAGRLVAEHQAEARTWPCPVHRVGCEPLQRSQTGPVRDYNC